MPFSLTMSPEFVAAKAKFDASRAAYQQNLASKFPFIAPIVSVVAPRTAATTPVSVSTPALQTPFGVPSSAPQPAETPPVLQQPGTTKCNVDWGSATAEMEALAASIRACSSPYDSPMPAEIAECPAGSDGGIGSRSSYLAARGLVSSAMDEARVLCARAQPTPTASTPVSTTTTSASSDPYSAAGVVQQQVAEEIPLIEDRPVFSRKQTVIGGSILAVGIAWWFLRRRNARRKP